MTQVFAPHGKLSDLHERTAPEREARSIADLHYDLGKALDRCGLPLAIDLNRPRHNPNTRMFRGLQIDAVVRPVSPAPTDVDPARYAKLNADWAETERLFEAARVKFGRGSPAYRAEVRRILDRPEVAL